MRAMIWTAANFLMLLAFVFSVVVQLNDPDPLPWVAIYGLAAAACLLELAGRGVWLFPALLAGVAGLWAGTLAPRVIGHVRFGEMFGAFEMANTSIEESREMYGLLFIAFWMALLAIRRARAGKASQRTRQPA